jgi:hypothetical protein
VVYAQVLERVSTGKQNVAVIATVPGTLRRPGAGLREGGRAQKLVEIIPRAELCGRELQVRPDVIQPFPKGGTDVKIEPKEDPGGVEVKYLVDKSNKEPVFRLTTML